MNHIINLRRLHPRLAVLMLVLLLGSVLAASSVNYRIDWSQQGAGGGEGRSSANYRMTSFTVGQPAAGFGQSANYRQQLGYQQVFGTPLPTITPGGPTLTPTPVPPTATPGGPTPTDCPIPFVDVNGNVFYTAIKFLYCRGVVNGTDATHYTPAGTSTRGQFAKVVTLGFGTPFYTPAQPSFSDVPTNYFAFLFIETGYHAGILSGFDAQSCANIGATFPCYGPNRPITRAQLTKLVVNAGGFTLYTPTQPTYSDVGTNNVFYVSIETAAHYSIINGYVDNTFRPNNNIRRDEMAQIVYKGITTNP